MSAPGTAPTLDELRRAWVRINYSGEIRRLGSAEDVYNRALALFDHPEYSIAALPASLPAPPAVTPEQIAHVRKLAQHARENGWRTDYESLYAVLAALSATPTPGEGR